jgi:predicted ATPase
MQLSNLNFSNFKNWKNFNTDLAKINLFFGQNSSGKSSIIQLLLLLKQTVENKDEKVVLYFGDDKKSYVNLGNFDEILNKAALNKKLTIGFSFKYFFSKINFNVEIDKKENGIIDVNKLNILDIKNGNSINVQRNNKNFEVNCKGAITNEEVLVDRIKSFYGLPFNLFNENESNDVSHKLDFSIRSLLENIIYIGPLRENPKREYKWTASRHSHFGIRGENTFDAIITSITENEKYNSKYLNFTGSLAEIVGKWLVEFGMVEDFQIVPISEIKQLYQVNIKTKGSKNWVDICDVGFGVSQILPIIALCYYAPNGSIIIIEQPEIHLHPKVQSGLGDLLIDAALSRNIQFIIESHSEHLLTRIQRRIAEEKIDDKHIKINFCNLVDGESVLEELKVDDFGEISNWPENFFGDEMEEIYQMQKAILKRKMNPAQVETDEDELPF